MGGRGKKGGSEGWEGEGWEEKGRSEEWEEEGDGRMRGWNGYIRKRKEKEVKKYLERGFRLRKKKG